MSKSLKSVYMIPYSFFFFLKKIESPNSNSILIL